MAAVISTKERIKSVQIEGLALLKIVKHCHDSLPHMVTGSVLGLEMENGVLEITHSFPLPVDTSKHNGATSEVIAENVEYHKYQEEMMRMLRDVNVDNNCVGWYQSMYMGIYSTSSLLENQLAYQMGLGPNSVAILYDPMQTTHGNFVLKCYRLTEKCVKITSADSNDFVSPNEIFEEVPVELTNPGLVKVLLEDVADGVHNTEGGLHASNADTTFDRLDLTTNPYLEKHLEFLSGWMDDLAAEQHKFQYYTRQLSRGSKDKSRRKADIAAGWASTDAPRRLESLLISNQIRSYCDQMDNYTSGGLSKLFLTEGIHKEE